MEIVETIGLVRSNRRSQDAEQEIGRRKDTFDAALDSRIEGVLAPARFVKIEKNLHFALSERTPIRARCERRENFPRAGLLGRRILRRAEEHLSPRR